MKIKAQEHSVKKTEGKSSLSELLNNDISLFGNSFSNKAKEQFYGELSVLLTSGINLKGALDLILDMQTKKKDSSRIESLRSQIVQGSSLSKALEKDANFSAYEYRSIGIGEQTGALAKITGDLREYFARKNELKRQLITSLSYPIIVLITAFIVVFFMLRYVVPMFEDIFKQNRVELPWITEKIMGLSNFVRGNGWLLLGITLGVIILFKWIAKQQWYYHFIGKIQLRIPVFGNYLKKIYLIQFTQAMALLTNAKIPVTQGIGLVKKMIRFYPLEESLAVIEKDIVRGEKLHDSFSKHSLFDKKMVALLKVAEETNQTEYIFKKLYDQYSSETKYQGQIITNVLNLILTVLVGLIVGVILVAMYLPMFKLSSVIG